MSRLVLLLALGSNLAACSDSGRADIVSAASEPQRAAKMPRSKQASLTGWGPFTFGMRFDDALGAYPGLEWDPASLGKCRDEMRSIGCTLVAAPGAAVPPTAGITLLPGLVFNPAGQLALVRLGTFFRGDSAAQCERAYARLLGHLRLAWGAPAASPQLGSDDGAIDGKATFHLQPDGRRIVLRTASIAATASAPAVCHLAVDYRGPANLQPPPERRPHPLKNWQ